MRFGIGYDAHRLVEGEMLVIGGIIVPYDHGLEGHSDGDVVCHAIIDAVLGAAALGDIGSYFKSENPDVPSGISSLILLERTVGIIRSQAWDIENVDATIVAEMPRLSSYIGSMRKAVSGALKVPVDRVSIKATTTDGLGFPGRGEGIAAYAVASLIGSAE
jgi:2-C-methyl-D-erythritol 2,4-cyclodiphosphate synthase